MGSKHVFDAAKLGIAALAQIEVHRIFPFFAAALAGDHSQIDTAGAGRKSFRIVRDRHHAIDGIAARGNAFFEICVKKPGS